MFDYILDFSAPPPPPAHKISNNILIYIYFLQDIAIGAPLPVIKIVKYCGVWGGGGGGIGGRQYPAKNNGAPPLRFVLKIVKYCGVVGGGGALVALKSYKHNGAPSLSLRLLSILWHLGRGGIGGRQNPTKNNGAPLSAIKIAKYCGVVGGGGGIGGAKILQT